jgi:hypothetical protein
LELVVKNVMYFVPKNWSLYIFHSQNNEDMVKEIIGADKLPFVNLIQICDTNLTYRDYNTLLATEMFWNWIKAEHVLIFQTDSYLRRNGIEEFLKYDYVGAPWKSDFMKSGSKQSGNGGLSLRRKSKILQVIKKNNYTTGMHEDTYFQIGLENIGANLPEVETSKQFSVETIYYDNPIGVHRYWDYVNDEKGSLCKLEITFDLQNEK